MKEFFQYTKIDGDEDRMNRKKWEEIYNRYVRLVAFVVSKYLSDEEDVKDLTNEVFVRFFERTSTETVGNLQSYLTVSAKNAAINHLKKRKEVCTLDENRCLSGEDSLSSFRYREFVSSLRRFLKDEEIDILIDHDVYGYSFREIAAFRNRNAETVKTLYRRAVLKLREKGEEL